MEGHIKELREQLLDQKKYNNELNNVRIRTTEELQATLRNLKKASENVNAFLGGLHIHYFLLDSKIGK
jgi:hypothetical protein